MVVYTPAIDQSDPLLRFVKEKGWVVRTRAWVLGAICQGKQVVGVAGTHGKTTTTAIISHLLYQANVPMWGFVGGTVDMYETNLVRNCSFEDAQWVVVEACEFNRSFLHLLPTIGWHYSRSIKVSNRHPDYPI